MDPISKQYQIGKSFQLCSITDLGFAPRDGYQFRYWIDNNDKKYENGETIIINDRSFSISAVWQISSEIIPSGEVDKDKIKEYNDSYDIWWMK